jgi:hypothetical protein
MKPAAGRESLADAPKITPVAGGKLLLRVSAFYAKTLFKDMAGLDYLLRSLLDRLQFRYV